VLFVQTVVGAMDEGLRVADGDAHPSRRWSRSRP
jgi:hypothetical protein